MKILLAAAGLWCLCTTGAQAFEPFELGYGDTARIICRHFGFEQTTEFAKARSSWHDGPLQEAFAEAKAKITDPESGEGYVTPPMLQDFNEGRSAWKLKLPRFGGHPTS